MAVNSRTSLKLRSAWMPPAVAQAPMVISVRDWRRTSCSRSASCGVVTEPSTSDTSYGPFQHAAGGLREIGDLHRAGDGQQFVLAIQQRELAAVAGGELPDGELGFAGHGNDSPALWGQDWGSGGERRGPRPAAPALPQPSPTSGGGKSLDAMRT